MTEKELAMELRQRYDKAKINEATLETHLFGIDYAGEIKSNAYNIAKIVELAGLGKGYVAEISKGIKLAERVERKEDR